MKYIYLIFLLTTSLSAQHPIHFAPSPDTSRFIPVYRNPMFIGGAFIAGGIASYHQNLKEEVRDYVRGHFKHQQTIEDYLQYGAYGLLFGGQLAGQKPLHNPRGQLVYAALSDIGAVGVTTILKALVHDRRPNGGHYSFPSGHTTQAFAAATVVYWEYRDSHPWLAYAGYSFALSTGFLRMVHDKHWINDVLAGAGIGILVPTLVYYYRPFSGMKWYPADENISFFPVYQRGSGGIGFRMKW